MMGLKRFRSLVLLTTAAGVAVPAAAQVAPATSAPRGIEEIIVTAQKREQNLQDVPISITAVTANQLAANRVQDVRDLSAMVPNLTVRPSAGGSQVPNYTLRGILTGGSSVGTDKGVALYLDGVYIQNTAGSIFEAANIERIEVLKGPQGTLFGRNATGGAISYITRDPTGEFGVRQELSYGNYNSFRSKTHVDLPQFGPLSLSATYLHKENRGYTRNLGAGTVWDYGPATGGALGKRTSPKYLGSDNVEAISAVAKLELSADLTATYKFDYSQNDYVPEANGLGYFPDAARLVATGASSLAGLSAAFQYLYAQQDPALRTPVSRERPAAVNNAFTTPSYARNVGHNLTVKWQATDELSFKNILAYRTNLTNSTFQLDGIGGLRNLSVPALGGAPASFLGNGCLAPPPNGVLGTPAAATLCGPAVIAQSLNQPFSYLTNVTFNDQSQWSNEFQANIQTDWFTMTAGYLYFHGKQKTAGFAGIRNTGTLLASYGQNTPAVGTPFVIPGNPGYQPAQVTVKSHAVYVQPEIHLTDQIDFIVGGRITKDVKNGVEYYPIQPRTPQTSPIRYRNSQVNYLVGLNYRPVDGVLTYVKYSTGYISGGQLATISFDPETAKSFEAGIKADLFNRRFRTNLAVFDVKYKAIQYTGSGTLVGVPTAFPFGSAVVPSADAHAYGAEWENTLVPVDGLTLTANGGYLHFKIDQDTVFGGTSLIDGSNCFGPSCRVTATGGFVSLAGATGYQSFGRPKWTGSFSAQYETGEIFAGGHLVVRGDANFQSKNLMSPDVTPGTSTPTTIAIEDPELRRAGTKPFTWIVNGRVALTDFQLSGTKATIALWGRNLFNNRSIVQFVPLGPVGTAIYERPCTYGLDLAVEF